MEVPRFLWPFLSQSERNQYYRKEILKMYEEKNVEELIQLLGKNDLDGWRQDEAESALALIGERALNSLKIAFYGHNSSLGHRVLIAITRMGQTGLETLIQGLNHENRSVRFDSVKGIHILYKGQKFHTPDGDKEITIKSIDVSRAIEPLLKCINDPFSCHNAVDFFTDFHDSRAIIPLQKLLVKEIIARHHLQVWDTQYSSAKRFIQQLQKILNEHGACSDIETLFQRSWVKAYLRNDLEIEEVIVTKFDKKDYNRSTSTLVNVWFGVKVTIKDKKRSWKVTTMDRNGSIESVNYSAQEGSNLIEAHLAAKKGVSYEKSEQWLLAIEEYKKSIVLAPGNDPSLATYHTNLGVCYAKVGKIDESIRELEIALQLDPENERALFNLQGVKLSK
jgi:tetratricopeptide (TPR) repeat protein